MRSWVALVLLTAICAAQFPPAPRGVTTIPAKQPGVSISYKKTCICESKADAYAGYVHMPPSYNGQTYNMSMFFWYFEARNNPQHAPTTIYLAGGAGESSTYSAANEGGPCYVLEDSNTTTTNPWSYNEYSNVLYIDQPVGTGFSYTSLVNITQDWLFLGDKDPTDSGATPLTAYKGDVPPQNMTFTYGTLSSQDPSVAPNSTVAASRLLWKFAQAWFQSFPERRTDNSNVNFFGNSYAGFWITITASHFFNQNEKAMRSELDGAIVLPLDTVGFTNGCIDLLYQADSYPDQAYNNTYGLQVISKEAYEAAKHNFTKPSGCRDLIQQCRSLGQQYDPDNLNDNPKVVKACLDAWKYCSGYVYGAFDVLSNRSDFDMAHLIPDPGPPTNTPIGFFQQAWVQAELGVPLNFTQDSAVIEGLYYNVVGDPARIAGKEAMENLLNGGVKIALVYGDRDYRCPWNSIEKLSLLFDWTGAESFHNAGYEFIRTNDTYNGGVVRQYGNLSFSRVFQSGHGCAAYQPETVSRIFNRMLFDQDVATGTISTSKGACHAGSDRCGQSYSSRGPQSSFDMVHETLPPPPPFQCYLESINSCTQEQYDALVNGTAVVKDLFIVGPKGGSPGRLGGFIG